VTGCGPAACPAGAVAVIAGARCIGTGRTRPGRGLVVTYNAAGRRLLRRPRATLRVRVEWREPGEPVRYGFSTVWTVTRSRPVAPAGRP